MTRQMKIALYGLSATQAQQTLIAYEPIWAIGEQGVPATPEQAAEIHPGVACSALCAVRRRAWA